MGIFGFYFEVLDTFAKMGKNIFKKSRKNRFLSIKSEGI